MQKRTLVKGNDIKNKAKNVYVEFEEWKRSIIVFIAEEICSWLSPSINRHDLRLLRSVLTTKSFFCGYRFYCVALLYNGTPLSPQNCPISGAIWVRI